jgi:hypothetical protein
MKGSVDDLGDPIDCAHGHHAPLEALEPSDTGMSVQVEWRCPACMRVVQLTSWTKEAWLKDQAKKRAQA